MTCLFADGAIFIIRITFKGISLQCLLDLGMYSMKEYDELINQVNSSRVKIYYNLSELMDKTGLSIRALKYRMLDVKRKYENIPTLLSKKNHTWRIHYTIINEFDPKYRIKNRTAYNYNWTTTATWNPKYNYDIKYHLHLLNEVKSHLPGKVISYAIEQDLRGVNHTHLLTDADTQMLNTAITITLGKYYADPKEWQIKLGPVLNKYSSVDYLKKAPLASGIIE